MSPTLFPAFLITILILGLFGALAYGSYLSDPYFKDSKVSSPFKAEVSKDGDIHLKKGIRPHFVDNVFSRVSGYIRTGLRIPLYSLLTPEAPFPGNENQIIAAIHAQRFNPDKPYVITGSHYSDLYVRNMGVFFNALLDPRIPSTPQDWENRQRLALQTIAYDIAFIEQAGKAVTTIVPLNAHEFTGLNIYEYPSDANFAILYTLNALTDTEFIAKSFPIYTQQNNLKTPEEFGNISGELQTVLAGQMLLDDSREALSSSLNHYLEFAFDPELRLIKKDVFLSSARDGVKRKSAFYDNVILWATVQLADSLQIAHSPTPDREIWKQSIVEAFWDEELGIFKDDLSDQPETQFSADSLIVTSTGFLDLKRSDERIKLQLIVAYIQAEKLDQPFPLRYSRSNHQNNMQWAVKYFAPSYMGDGIWSHWGMEYIKAELLLADLTPSQCELASDARQHLEKYRQNIEKYGGYPELYNADGTIFTSPLVHSVLHTGWVVNYEQAKMLSTQSRCAVELSYE